MMRAGFLKLAKTNPNRTEPNQPRPTLTNSTHTKTRLPDPPWQGDGRQRARAHRDPRRAPLPAARRARCWLESLLASAGRWWLKSVVASAGPSCHECEEPRAAAGSRSVSPPARAPARGRRARPPPASSRRARCGGRRALPRQQRVARTKEPTAPVRRDDHGRRLKAARRAAARKCIFVGFFGSFLRV